MQRPVAADSTRLLEIEIPMAQRQSHDRRSGDKVRQKLKQFL